MHGDVSTLGNCMVVNYVGALRQALLDMADWIQNGSEPPKSTDYVLQGGQVIVEPDPVRRHGIQPMVQLTANGQKCARVKIGGEFVLRAEIKLPQGAGEVTSVRYDFSDCRTYPGVRGERFPIQGSFLRNTKDGLNGAVSEMVYRFNEPGTYFIAVRVMSQRQGNSADAFTQVQNLDRVRVMVEE